MSSRAALIRAKSLYTFSNELNLPEGALVIAKNCNIDEPSVLTPRRGYNDFGSALPLDTDRVKQLMQYKGRLIRHYDDILQWETNASDFTSFTGNYKELEEGLRIKFQESNGNLYFTTDDGIKKISATSSTNFANLSITSAGGIKAVDLTAKTFPTSGGFLPAQSKVAYRIVFGITDANNNLILGEPSSRFVLTNTDADVKVPEKSKITVAAFGSIVDGDYITFDTPQVQYAIWMNRSGSEPENADLLGRQIFEVDATGEDSDTVAASIATTISKNITDVTVELSSNEVTITNTEEGDTNDITTNNRAAFTVASTIDGSVTFGSSANSDITFTLPDGITNDHFYQIYRTANITVTEGITTLNDLDPGEEYNLVYEAGITSTDRKKGEINIEDITTETFRASGLPLYTNPITGQGILQSNARPPVAKDVALFRNSMFYANTKLNHRKEISLLSVNGITSGTTEFIIGNQDGLSTYTFVGTAQSADFTADVGTPQDTTFTADTFANTTEGGYISVYSANDETLYIIQLDKGAAVDPAIPNSTLIQVDISTAVSAQDIKDDIESALATNTDLIYTDVGGNDFNIINVKNGPSTTPTVTGLGGAWAVGTTNTGVTYNSGYIIINSSNDERKYVLLIDEGGATDPAIKNSILIRVDISLATTAQDVKDAIEIALADNIDFTYSDLGGSDFNLLNTNNGPSTNPTVNKLGGSWAVAVGTITAGTGEDAANNEVLLSGLVSVSQAIDETARSLVRVINKDSNSPVIATYLSGEGDLPGQILLENKSLADEPFYLSTNDTNFQAEVNPELPSLETITTITPSGTQTVIEAAGHELFIGDYVYISSPESFPALGGKYEIVATNDNDFTINVDLQTGDATNSFYWLADVESDNVESPNRIYFSKLSQPESVPIVNFVDIGPQDEPIERIVALRDNLMVFKTDGIYILTGSSALSGFSVRLLDGSSSLAAPDSATVLDNQIFCLTGEGVSTVTETGVSVISRPIEDRIFGVVNSRFNFKDITFGVAYDSDKAYCLWLPEKVNDTVATQCYRYNTYERSWTRWDIPATCGLVKQSNDKMYLGAGDREYVYQERKNGDRTDHCDRSFILQVPADNAVNGENLRVSNIQELEIGDAILQEQYVTIAFFNRLLRKLDLDKGLTDSDYESSLKAIPGDNIAEKMSDLNTKLIADDDSGTITAHTFLNSDWVDLQAKYNELIAELNDALCDTSLKDYKDSEGITPYEALITEIDTIRNVVTLNYPLPLLEGDFEAFKMFETVIQWSPQHFGDPSGTKQVREGTVMFDQNNFYSAFLAYSSDLSASFVEDSFRGKGTGYFGYGTYGDPNVYWGGNGNDIPYRTIIPRQKQRGRYLNVRFRHSNAREYWRIVGISAVVKSVSSRGYR